MGKIEPDPELRSYENDSPRWSVVIILAIIGFALVAMLWIALDRVEQADEDWVAIADSAVFDSMLISDENILCFITVDGPWTEAAGIGYPSYDTLLARIDIDSLMTELTIIDSRSDTFVIDIRPPVRLEVRTR